MSYPLTPTLGLRLNLPSISRSCASAGICHSPHWPRRARLYMSPKTRRFAKLQPGAYLLLRAVWGYGAVGIDLGGIVIGEEANKENDRLFRRHCLRTACDGRRLQKVTAVFAGGDAKVLTKCGKWVDAPIRAGGPWGEGEKRGETKPISYGIGWFFYICPKSSVILHDVAMYGPVNNEIAPNGLEGVVGRYPYAGCFIYDRARKILNGSEARTR